MRKDEHKRARVAMLVVALLLPMTQTAHAIEILYARAIGDPYSTPPAVSAPPAQQPRKVESGSAPELPGLGTTPKETNAPVQTEESNWSVKKILIGVVLIGAIAALANKGGGSGDAPPASSAPSGGGDGGSGGGGSGGSPLPIPVPVATPSGGGGDDDDDKKGRGRNRVLLPAISF